MKKIWRWWPLLLLIPVTIAAVIFLRQRSARASNNTNSLTSTFAARRGSLTASISPTGEVYAPRQVSLSFDVNKTPLLELNVKPGQQVKAGEVLARIDPTALERAVIQAEADLTAAKDSLEKARNPYSELDLLQAKVAVEQAEANLQEAKDKLAQAQEAASELDIAQAKLTVEQAKTALEEARQKLAEAKQPASELDLAAARLAVAQAETALEEARENLEKVKAGPTAAQLATAEAALKAAQEKYKTLLAGPDPDTVQQAKLKLDQARNSLWSAQSSRDATCGAVERGQGSKSQCDSANANVLNAEIAVQLAEMSYRQALQPPSEADIASAAAQVEKAKSDLEELRKSPTAVAIAKAQTQVSQAEYNLASAKEKLAELEAGPDALKIAQLETQVAQAEYNLANAQKKLEDLLAGPDELELIKLKAQVSQAMYNLAKAQDQLAKIQAGPDPKEIEIAEAKYISTQARLEEARAALEAATMVAPFDGTVISVGAEVGDLVSANTVIVVLADLTDLRVRAIVDETDITKVEVGQQVQVTFDAFPGQRFWGQVLEVPLQGRLSQNVLVYEVPISLEGAESVALKPGMTANLKIIVGKRENALLIPALAVQQDDEGYFVMVQNTPGEPAVATPVQIGLSDGVYVEVVRGLVEGDIVQVAYQSSQQRQGLGFIRGAAGVTGPGRAAPGGPEIRIIGP